MADDIFTKDLIAYDPLSETTRKERTSLLGLSTLGVALVKVPLVPEKFGALGVDVTHVNQAAFVRLYAVVVIYYVVAFGLYAFTDYVGWRRSEVIRLNEYSRQQSERPPVVLTAPDGSLHPALEPLASLGSKAAAAFHVICSPSPRIPRGFLRLAQYVSSRRSSTWWSSAVWSFSWYRFSIDEPRRTISSRTNRPSMVGNSTVWSPLFFVPSMDIATNTPRRLQSAIASSRRG